MAIRGLWEGWEVLEQIGSGGFSKVYKIRKIDDDEDYFSALKVVSIPNSEEEYNQYRYEGYDDESITNIFKQMTDRLVSEFKLMRKFRGNSNIVSYEDHKIVPKTDMPGCDILIRMELCTPLPQYYSQQSFGEKDIIKLATDICTALEVCEKFNIVHRDIKPQNIFVGELGDFKLGDFGIARVMDHATRATRVGTHSYISPEVYNGTPSDNRGDIYCLGMVLYWLLNERRLPFVPLPPAMPTPEDTEMANMRRLGGEPLPPPKNGSPALKAAVMKALSFNPEARFASAAQFKAALTAKAPVITGDKTVAINRRAADPNDTVLVNKGIQKTIQPQNPKAPKQKKSKAWIVALILAFVLIGSGIAVVFSLLGNEETPIEEPTEVIQTNSEAEDVTDDGATNSLPPIVSMPESEGADDSSAIAPPVEEPQVNVGDYITFGSYEQDNNTGNGKEAIEWLVLDVKDGKALVISKYALDCQPYYPTKSDTTWEECTLRQWLNDDFFNAAFSQAEKTKISTTTVKAADNTKYGTEAGNDTQDKVFILSVKEAEAYFTTRDERKCFPTEYAKAKGAFTSSGETTYGLCWWWLRTPGRNQRDATRVTADGVVCDDAQGVNDPINAIRPVLWISVTEDDGENNKNQNALSSVNAGDYITFGSYEQDNNTGNGKEEIEWLVLDVKDGRALVISKYALECQPYNTSGTSVTWETCTLRTWLNGSFYNTAFGIEEKSKIPTVTVVNDDNPRYDTEGGNNTSDKVFLLSIDEANTYFSSDSARECEPTAYAKAQGAHISASSSYYGNCWWWLRSPGDDRSYAASVDHDGGVGDFGDYVGDSYFSVRPALWIEL